MTDLFSDPNLNVSDLTTIIEEFTTMLVSLTALGSHVVEARHADRVTQLTRFVEHLNLEERRAIASALSVLARVVELGKNAPSSLRPLPSESREQHTERPKEKE